MGGGVLLNGVPSTAVNTALYYETAAEQGAAIFRAIARGHMFANGNKRTAVLTWLSFAKQNGIETKNYNQLLDITTEIVEKQIDDVEEISKMLSK